MLFCFLCFAHYSLNPFHGVLLVPIKMLQTFIFLIEGLFTVSLSFRYTTQNRRTMQNFCHERTITLVFRRQQWLQATLPSVRNLHSK